MINQQAAQKQNKITRLIENRYNPTNNRLDLNSLKSAVNWKQLLQYQDWKSIKILYLVNCNIQDSDVSAVTQNCWDNLEQLDLKQNMISNCQQIWQKQWPMLKILNINQNKIQKNGLKSMKQIKMPNLKVIDLSFNNIGTGINLLIKARFPLLQIVYLDTCQITNNGVAALTKAKWPKLMYLWIQNNQIGVDGYQSLINCQISEKGLMSTVRNQFNLLKLCLCVVKCRVEIFDNKFYRNMKIKQDIYKLMKKR